MKPAQEHLATSDKGVVLYHNLLLDNIAKVERGEEPMAVIRDPEVNEPHIAVKHESVGYQSFRINREVAGAGARQLQARPKNRHSARSRHPAMK